MAKALHITIDTFVGTREKEDGTEEIGFMNYMLAGAIEANPESPELILHLDCPGGCTYEGNKIYSTLLDFRNTEGKTLTVINESMAASMATVFVQAATPGRRLSRPLAPFMVHKPLFPELNWVNADDLEKAIAQLNMLESTFAKIYSEASGRTIEMVHADMREAQFITAEEALSRGYIDEILQGAPMAKPKEREAQAVAFYNPPKTNPTNNVMNEEQQTSFADKIINGIAALLKPKAEADPAPVAASELLENGESIYFEGALEEGKAVFSDPEMTNALADGDYVLSDGRTITVADGAVTAITEAAPANSAELEAANARIAELESQLAAQASAKDTTIKNLRAELATAKKVTPPQNFAGDNNTPKEESKEVVAFKKAFNKK